MATFSSKTFKALNYNSFRPTYPPSFYNVLTNYMGTPKVKTAMDLGCGTGVATYPLLNISDKVVGLDLSPKMIEIANSLVESRCKELQVSPDTISFKVGAVEDFLYHEPREIEDESVDLITAAQCIHWFQDFNKFFENSSHLLKSGGTLAYFFYVDPVITSFSGNQDNKAEKLEKAFQIYHKYVYQDPNWIGSYWEQPGRGILANMCEEVNRQIPLDIFEDVKVKTYYPQSGAPITSDDLDMKKEGIKLGDLVDYIATYSGYHAFDTQTGRGKEFLSSFLQELESETGWNRNDTLIDLVWNTGYTLMKKKN